MKDKKIVSITDEQNVDLNLYFYNADHVRHTAFNLACRMSDMKEGPTNDSRNRCAEKIVREQLSKIVCDNMRVGGWGNSLSICHVDGVELVIVKLDTLLSICLVREGRLEKGEHYLERGPIEPLIEQTFRNLSYLREALKLAEDRKETELMRLFAKVTAASSKHLGYPEDEG